MVAPLIAGAVRVAGKKTAKRTASTSSRFSRKNNISQRRRSRAAITADTESGKYRSRPSAQQTKMTTHTPDSDMKKKGVTSADIKMTARALKTALFLAFPILFQIIFSVIAFDAFVLEDKWYGFAIPAFTVGASFYIISTLFSGASIAYAGFSMRKYLKNTSILLSYLLCCSAAIALPIVPWPLFWLGYITLTTLFKQK